MSRGICGVSEVRKIRNLTSRFGVDAALLPCSWDNMETKYLYIVDQVVRL